MRFISDGTCLFSGGGYDSRLGTNYCFYYRNNGNGHIFICGSITPWRLFVNPMLKLRKDTGEEQIPFSRMLGISQSQLSKIENYKVDNFSVDLILSLIWMRVDLKKFFKAYNKGRD